MRTITSMAMTLLITMFLAAAVAAQGWSTDVLISSHDSVFAVELESSHFDDRFLLAVIAYVEDGDNKWSTYFSNDGGDTWTHTFTRTTTTLTSISCANNRIDFYVLVGEFRPRLFRFDGLSGMWWDFTWGPYATVDPDNRWYDVVVTTQDRQDSIYAVGEYGGVNLTSRVSSFDNLEDWSYFGGSEYTNVDRGLDACATLSNILFVSYFDADNSLRILNGVGAGMWDEMGYLTTVYSNHNHTSIYGEHGWDGPSFLLVCAFEFMGSNSIGVYSTDDFGDNWTSDYIVHSGRTCSAPAVTCEGNGVGLAYSTRLTTTPFFKSTAFHWDLTPELMADDAEETWATESVDQSIKPDIEYFGGFYGIAYVSIANGGEAWFTRTLSCCQIRGDIDHNGTAQPDIADLVYLVTFMFQGGPEPICMMEADIDGNDTPVPDIADLVYLVTYMFQGGPTLVPCP